MTCFLATACSAGEPSSDVRDGDPPGSSSVARSEKEDGLIPIYEDPGLTRELQPSRDRKFTQGGLGRDYSASDTADALPVADAFLTDFYFRKARFGQGNKYVVTASDLKNFEAVATPAAYDRFVAIARRIDGTSRENEKALRAWIKSGKKKEDYVDNFPPTVKDDANELGSFLALAGPEAYTYRQRTVEIYASTTGDQEWRGNLVVHYRLRGGPKPHIYEVWVGLKLLDGAFKIDNLSWHQSDVK